MTWSVVQADCLDWLRSLPEGSVDLVFGSPPYEQARLYLELGWVGGNPECAHEVIKGPVTEKYGICRCGAKQASNDLGVSRKTGAWVEWMADVHEAAQRACKGLVAFVVAGQTRNYRWSAGPVLLMAELHRRGLNLRNPPIFHRVGIPGSGGPDWLRSDYEWIVCTSRPGRLPWSDNTACGHPPKWAPGGEMSHRLTDGQRKNGVTDPWMKRDRGNNMGGRNADGSKKKGSGLVKEKKWADGTGRCVNKRRVTRGHKNGDTPNSDSYDSPALANPGNVIAALVGGGVMGNELCHENEAPFPEDLAAFFVQSFCPPGGTCCDPFSGSGTTGAVSVRHGRNFLGADLRESQVLLSRKRIGQETPLALFEG